MTPLMMAKDTGNMEIIEFLEEQLALRNAAAPEPSAAPAPATAPAPTPSPAPTPPAVTPAPVASAPIKSETRHHPRTLPDAGACHFMPPSDDVLARLKLLYGG